MSSITRTNGNGKVAVTTLETADIEQMSLALNLPDLRTSLMDRVQTGQVVTGSEWDGWPLDRIYLARIAAGDDPDTAAGLVDAIEENRFHFARNPLGSRPALDEIEEAIAAEEPWFWEEIS